MSPRLISAPPFFSSPPFHWGCAALLVKIVGRLARSNTKKTESSSAFHEYCCCAGKKSRHARQRGKHKHAGETGPVQTSPLRLRLSTQLQCCHHSTSGVHFLGNKRGRFRYDGLHIRCLGFGYRRSIGSRVRCRHGCGWRQLPSLYHYFCGCRVCCCRCCCRCRTVGCLGGAVDAQTSLNLGAVLQSKRLEQIQLLDVLRVLQVRRPRHVDRLATRRAMPRASPLLDRARARARRHRARRRALKALRVAAAAAGTGAVRLFVKHELGVRLAAATVARRSSAGGVLCVATGATVWAAGGARHVDADHTLCRTVHQQQTEQRRAAVRRCAGRLLAAAAARATAAALAAAGAAAAAAVAAAAIQPGAADFGRILRAFMLQSRGAVVAWVGKAHHPRERVLGFAISSNRSDLVPRPGPPVASQPSHARCSGSVAHVVSAARA
mmetsp:Transcript_14156/g.41112  ORF Transcript_14156/g.41112 Transcript_14156/m.41112 type:complete len:438 (+) Transcript_14156:1380-2693(+)